MTHMTLNDEFPLLRALGVLEGEAGVHGYIIAGIVNTSASDAYTLHTERFGEHTCDLRIVGLGDACYLVWIDERGNTVGAEFNRLEVGETSRLKSHMSHDLAKSA